MTKRKIEKAIAHTEHLLKVLNHTKATNAKANRRDKYARQQVIFGCLVAISKQLMPPIIKGA